MPVKIVITLSVVFWSFLSWPEKGFLCVAMNWDDKNIMQNNSEIAENCEMGPVC